MKPALSHLRTSFLTTSFITGFNLLWCSIEGFALSTIRILCMQIDGLIPFKFLIDQAIASLYFLRVSTTFFSFSEVRSVAMITGLDFSSPKNAYFKCLGSSFRISPLELFYASRTFTSMLLTSSSFPSLKFSTVSISLALALSCFVMP